jgi:hypothetical protein
MKRVKNQVAIVTITAALGVSMCGAIGCERKEKVLDVETPHGEVEVERNVDTGQVDVTVERE